MTKLDNPHGHACYWYDAAEKFGAPNVKYCEETLCQVISEPALFWSNLSYFIVGIAIMIAAKDHKSSDIKILGPSIIVMGLGSAIYHMGNNYFFQILDFIGMYFYLFWALTINLRRIGYVSFKVKYPVYLFFVLLFTGLMHWLYLLGYKFQLIIVFAAFLIAITEFRLWRKRFERLPTYKYFLIALAFVIVGEVFSILDMKRVFCDPTNHFIQGHAIWHLLSGISCWFVFKHFSQSTKMD